MIECRHGVYEPSENPCWSFVAQPALHGSVRREEFWGVPGAVDGAVLYAPERTPQMAIHAMSTVALAAKACGYSEAEAANLFGIDEYQHQRDVRAGLRALHASTVTEAIAKGIALGFIPTFVREAELSQIEPPSQAELRTLVLMATGSEEIVTEDASSPERLRIAFELGSLVLDARVHAFRQGLTITLAGNISLKEFIGDSSTTPLNQLRRMMEGILWPRFQRVPKTPPTPSPTAPTLPVADASPSPQPKPARQPNTILTEQLTDEEQRLWDLIGERMAQSKWGLTSREQLAIVDSLQGLTASEAAWLRGGSAQAISGYLKAAYAKMNVLGGMMDVVCLLTEKTAKTWVPSPRLGLSEEEVTILRILADGKANIDIGNALSIKVSSGDGEVKIAAMKRTLFEKLGANNAVTAVWRAFCADVEADSD